MNINHITACDIAYLMVGADGNFNEVSESVFNTYAIAKIAIRITDGMLRIGNDFEVDANDYNIVQLHEALVEYFKGRNISKEAIYEIGWKLPHCVIFITL